MLNHHGRDRSRLPRGEAVFPSGAGGPGHKPLAGKKKGAKPSPRLLFEIRVENDLLSAGRKVWELCESMGFSSMEAMQVRTAFSELARNILKFAGEGEVIFNRLGDDGVRLIFMDEGPGIPDIEQAMGYGFSTAKSLGLGLPGSKKLSDKFDVHSEPGKGTRVTFVKYRKAKPVSRPTEEIRIRLAQKGLLRKDL